MPAITILTLLLYYLYMYKCTRTMNPIHSCVTDSAVWLIMAVTGKMNNGNVHCLQVQSFKLTVLFRYETSWALWVDRTETIENKWQVLDDRDRLVKLQDMEISTLHVVLTSALLRIVLRFGRMRTSLKSSFMLLSMWGMLENSLAEYLVQDVTVIVIRGNVWEFEKETCHVADEFGA